VTEAARAVDLLHGRPVVLVDGPAGSGKTTLARGIADLTGAPVIHLDELFEGWTGMVPGLAQAQRLLDERAAGRPAGYRRFDWLAGAYAEWVPVPPSDLLVIEGCGAGSLRADALLVWVEAPQEVCLRRGLARDGESHRGHWERWQDEERRHFEADGTPGRAELVVTTA
jgi:chloramphenicol 3-O-phosphotransferase